MPTTTDGLIAELVQEATTTRRVLTRVPESHLGWRPHARSRSLGQLAMHIAIVPGALAVLLSELNREVPRFDDPVPTSLDQILSAHDEGLRAATTQLADWDGDDLAAEWRMTQNGNTIMAMPRLAMVRSVMFNHLYHHRGQLTVYLRLLDVPVPSVYGPSADESPFSQAEQSAQVSGTG
ncbi:MAG TPA: DinB family protein [Gemmatimonadaceae bacterium]|nr:DinB family protein [Gemmatimonadaceae bacterium]